MGRSSGPIKALAGFRKAVHSVPDTANSATNAFLAKLCADELAEAAEQFFQAARTALAYKRKDISVSVTSPTANVVAKDFSIEISYAVEASHPSNYSVTTALRDLTDAKLAHMEAFRGVFRSSFSEIEFMYERSASVEEIIDAIEALDGSAGVSVDFPSDYRHCILRVEGVDAQVRCTAGTLEVVFSRRGSPADLIDGFEALRNAFQISPTLRGLIG